MNAPTLFQNFMEHCFQEYRDHKNLFHRIDDLLVYSKNVNRCINHLWLTSTAATVWCQDQSKEMLSILPKSVVPKTDCISI